jgi:hypothetical protein
MEESSLVCWELWLLWLLLSRLGWLSATVLSLNLSPAFFFTCSALLFLLEYFSLRHNWAQDVRPVHCSLVEKLGFWNCWELGLVPHFYCSSSVFTTTVNNISTY